MRALEAEASEARGDLEQARTYPFNPELGVDVGRRRGDLSSTIDYGVSLSQEIELGGQRGRRSRPGGQQGHVTAA